MKSIIVSIWLALVYLADWLGSTLNYLSGAADWSQLGWAFAGATVFVLYESVADNPKKRTLPEQLKLIAIGLFMALLLCKLAELGRAIHPVLDQLLALPPEVLAGGGGAAGYKLFDYVQRKKLKDPGKTLKEMNPLNGNDNNPDEQPAA